MVCKVALKAASKEEPLGINAYFSRVRGMFGYRNGSELEVENPVLVCIADLCLSTMYYVPSTGMIENSKPSK